MKNNQDSKIFQLSHNTALKNCITEIRERPIDGTTEVIIRHIKKAKTLAQLGGLFGVWVGYAALKMGESEDYIHRWWKSKFLSRIYANDYADPEAKAYPPEIDQWLELLMIYQSTGQTEKLQNHAKRISLSWANLSQMKRYMNAVESYYQSVDMPLPILDRFRKYYKSEAERD